MDKPQQSFNHSVDTSVQSFFIVFAIRKNPFHLPLLADQIVAKHESGSKESMYRHTEKKVTFWMSLFHVMVPGHIEYLHHYMVL